MKLGQMLLAMFDRPGQAMEAAVARPRSWWLPALLLLATLAALAYISAPYVIELTNTRQVEMVEQLAASMAPEQADIVRAQVRDMTLGSLMLNSVLFGGILMALGWLARAAIAHLSALAAGGKGVWASTFAAAGVWSMLPDVLRNLVQLAYTVVNQRSIEHSGLSFLVASGDWLADSRNLVYALLSSIDPFTLWHLILLTSAVAAATKLNKTKALMIALLTWAVLAGLRLIPVAISSALTVSLG